VDAGVRRVREVEAGGPRGGHGRVELRADDGALEDAAGQGGRRRGHSERRIHAAVADADEDARAAEVMAKLEERRAKLIGLDAPEKRELTGAEGGPIAVATPEAAARAVRELFGQHASMPGDKPEEP
jgi:hypothetical protein